MLSICRGVDRAYINNLFLARVRDSLIGEGQRTQDDQHDPGDRN